MFHKNQLDKPTAFSLPVDTASPIAKPEVPKQKRKRPLKRKTASNKVVSVKQKRGQALESKNKNAKC